MIDCAVDFFAADNGAQHFADASFEQPLLNESKFCQLCKIGYDVWFLSDENLLEVSKINHFFLIMKHKERLWL